MPVRQRTLISRLPRTVFPFGARLGCDYRFCVGLDPGDRLLDGAKLGIGDVNGAGTGLFGD